MARGRGVELATAYIPIVPSMRGATAAIQRELSPLSAIAGRAGASSGHSFVQGMGSKVSGAARSMFLPLVGGTAVLGGLAAAGAKMGLSVAAGNEQATISFTTMLGSAEKAGTFIKDLQSFAAKTPFEFAGLQQSASSLISAGIEANKVIPIMTTLGNVTSGMGTGAEGVQRATVALQQMSAAGRITGEDLNQLRDAGIPVYDLLAKATGKSKAEVVALAQAGKLGKKELDQMMKALETGAGLERFSGLMDKQSQSLTGMLSTFKDTFGQGLATALQPAIPLIKDGLGGATSLLAKALPPVTHGLGEFVGGVRAFRSAWKANDGDVTSSGFPGFMESVAFRTHQAADAVSKAAGPFRAFASAFKAGDGDITSSGFAGVMERIGGAARTTFDFLKANAPTALAAVQTAISAVKPQVMETVGKVFDSLRKTAQTLKPYLDKLWAQFGPTVQELLPSLVTLASAFNPVSLVVKGILPVLPQLADAFGKIATALADALLPILPPLADVLARVVNDGLGAFSGAISTVLPLVVSLADKLAPVAPYALGAFAAFKGAKAAASGISSVKDTVTGAIDTVKGFKDSVTDGIQSVKDFGASAKSGFESARLGAMYAKDGIGKAGSAVASGAKAAVGLASNLGKAALGYVSMGAKAVASAAQVVAAKAAQLAVAAATKAWAAAQWLINVALSANPIGLAVVAIAALAAGVIYAYKHSETFRNIVQGAFGAAKVAIGAVVDFVTTTFPPLFGTLTAPFTTAGQLIGAAVHGVTAAISGVVSWARANWPLLLAIITGPIGLATLAVVRNFDHIKAVFTTVKDWIGQRVTDIVGFVTGIPGRISGVATKAFDALKTGITTAKLFVVTEIDKVVTFFTGIGGKIASATSGMFDGIKTAFKSAINFVIESWNNLEFHIGGQSVFGKTLPGVTIGTPNIPPLRGFGGPVVKDQPYVVGDRGRAELFVPEQNGTILPRVPAWYDSDGGGGKGIRDVHIGPIYNPLPERVSETGPNVLRKMSHLLGS